MAEYIEREAALEITNRVSDRMLSVSLGRKVMNLPAADVVPVVHGRWVYEAETMYTKSGFRCSACRVPLWLSPDVPQAFLYCPNCGARMDGAFQNGNNHEKDWPSYMDLPRNRKDGDGK